MGTLLDRVVRRHPDAGLQRFSGRLLAVTQDDHLHCFEDDAGQPSEVAERIVELADGARTLNDIVDVLIEEFEVDRAVCERDVAAFVQALVDKKVLVFQ